MTRRTPYECKGYGPAVLDKFSENAIAIRGREPQLIDYYGGAQSVGGTSGNAMNGISPHTFIAVIYELGKGHVWPAPRQLSKALTEKSNVPGYGIKSWRCI